MTGSEERRGATKQRILIMGAAGRDFHNFNTFFRDNPRYEVVGFTGASAMRHVVGRHYPPELAGELYPKGIEIHEEADLTRLIGDLKVDQVVFSYCSLSHEEVMHKASRVVAAGADFRLMGTRNTQLRANKPVISVCAVRTGSGKSQAAQRVATLLGEMGLKPVIIKHPMPCGPLSEIGAVKRFACYEDLASQSCTIEEREEVEPHLGHGHTVFAGLDFEQVLRQAEEEGDVLVWDGGGNDVPFVHSDLHIVMVDPHRPGQEITYHPGEVNVLLADVLVINKVDTASYDRVLEVRESLRNLNPSAAIVEAASPVTVKDPSEIHGRRALVVEDGPTLTQGGMPSGAGLLAARKYGVGAVVDPRPYAGGSIAKTYASCPHIGEVLPAMGCGPAQIKELEKTINSAIADVVIAGTPFDLGKLLSINKPVVRVTYQMQEIGSPTLADILKERFGDS